MSAETSSGMILLGLGLLELLWAEYTDHRRERAILKRLRQESPAAALRHEAHTAMWHDRRVDRIAAELERVEGPKAAEQLRAEISSARAATSPWSRPVRGALGLLVACSILLVLALYLHLRQ